MPYGYSGPALAVGALSSAVGDYFKKQLETEMALPQLQQTMEALNQMKLAGLQRQAMAPMQMAQAQQGLESGRQHLAFLPEQQAAERERAREQKAQFGRLENIQWPYEQSIMQRRSQAMQDLQQRMARNNGQPLHPMELNQWVAQWGDALQGHPLAQHFKQYDPELGAQRQARAARDTAIANWYDKGRPGMGNQGQMTATGVQNALTAAHRQAEAAVGARLNEFKGIPNAQLGDFGERQQIYDWMVDNEYRKNLQSRGLGEHLRYLPEQSPMPKKLTEIMNLQVPGQEGPGIFDRIGRAWNWMTGSPSPQQPGQPQGQAPQSQAPAGFPKPSTGFGTPMAIPEPKPAKQPEAAVNQFHIQDEEDSDNQ